MNIKDFQEHIELRSDAKEPLEHIALMRQVIDKMDDTIHEVESDDLPFKQQAAEVLKHLSLLCSSVGVDLADIVEIAEEPEEKP